MHEWMLDNDLTPQIVVDANADDVAIPRQYVEDGRIVLNLSPSAVRHLSLGNERVEFMARFGGSPFQVSVGVAQVLAIVARENGAGMSFPEEIENPDDPDANSDSDSDDPPPSPPSGGRPRLTVVK